MLCLYQGHTPAIRKAFARQCEYSHATTNNSSESFTWGEQYNSIRSGITEIWLRYQCAVDSITL